MMTYYIIIINIRFTVPTLGDGDCDITILYYNSEYSILLIHNITMHYIDENQSIIIIYKSHYLLMCAWCTIQIVKYRTCCVITINYDYRRYRLRNVDQIIPINWLCFWLVQLFDTYLGTNKTVK